MLGTLDNSQCASNGFSSAGSKKDRTNLHRVCEENALKVVASPLNQHLEADEQIVFETQAGEMQCWRLCIFLVALRVGLRQRLQVTLLEPFSEYPWLRLQFLLPIGHVCSAILPDVSVLVISHSHWSS
jgi:hypothetical protein